MTTCPLSVEQLDTASYVIFLFKRFIPSIFSCLCIVQKHLAQTCCSISLADSQTFYQRYVFNGETHSLQTRKYDVSMTVEYMFPHKHFLKLLWKSKHFPQTYKTKRDWVFFSEHSVYRIVMLSIGFS